MTTTPGLTPEQRDAVMEPWCRKARDEGWEVDADPLYWATVDGLAWNLLEQTMDTVDREPSPEQYREARNTAECILADRAASTDIAPCSRCGENRVVNPRPTEDIVVCEPCMWECVSEADQDGWERGRAWSQARGDRYRQAWLNARRRAAEAAARPESALSALAKAASTGQGDGLRAAVEALSEQARIDAAHAICRVASNSIRKPETAHALRTVAAALDAAPAPTEDWEGVGTGASEGATGQDTGTAWVTRSTDYPAAPAQAHLLPALNREPDRMLAAIRAVLDADQAWSGNPDEAGALGYAIQRLRDAYLAAAAPAPTADQAKCGDCGHIHTPNGCTGDPTPSDLWAGVSVGGCDCAYDQATTDQPASTVGRAGDTGGELAERVLALADEMRDWADECRSMGKRANEIHAGAGDYDRGLAGAYKTATTRRRAVVDAPTAEDRP